MSRESEIDKQLQLMRLTLVPGEVKLKPLSAPGERIVSNVTYCVPAIGGSLTIQRCEAGWRFGLDCARGCELLSPRNLHYAGVKQIEHECARLDEHLVVPEGDEPWPELLRTEPDR